MNPDQNQPPVPAENPASEVPVPPTPEPTPEVPLPAPTPEPAPLTPVPEPAPTPVTPELASVPPAVPVESVPVAPVVDPVPAPVAVPTPPNPFGGPAVSSEPVAAIPLAQSTAPIGSSPVSNPAQSVPGNAKKKKLIILIAAIVGGLVILGVIALVVISLIVPSKSDYRDAGTQFNTVTTAYSDLKSKGSKLQYDIGGSTTDTQFTNDSDAVTKSLQSFQDAGKKLAAMKAIKFGDGQKLYATYDGKVNSFVAYTNDFLTSLKSFRPVAKACETVNTSTLLDECVAALNNVGTIPNADLKQYVSTLQTQYKAYQGVAAQIAAMTDPYGKQYTQYSALLNQSYSIRDKISAASSDLTSNANKHSDEVDPSTAANALSDFLTKKLNG